MLCWASLRLFLVELIKLIPNENEILLNSQSRMSVFLLVLPSLISPFKAKNDFWYFAKCRFSKKFCSFLQSFSFNNENDQKGHLSIDSTKILEWFNYWILAQDKEFDLTLLDELSYFFAFKRCSFALGTWFGTWKDFCVEFNDSVTQFLKSMC